MDIQFDPFSFGVATFALAVAVMQLYWNRPGAQRQNAVSKLLYPSDHITSDSIPNRQVLTEPSADDIRDTARGRTAPVFRAGQCIQVPND
jgi:hypothetical protein